jgi:hypothetical protein
MPLTRAPRKILTSWMPSNELGPSSEKIKSSLLWESLKKALQSNDLPTEFVKWREMAADQNQWRAICGSKTPSTSQELPTSPRQDIWAKPRYENVPS